jgi:hypothetical protein
VSFFLNAVVAWTVSARNVVYFLNGIQCPSCSHFLQSNHSSLFIFLWRVYLKTLFRKCFSWKCFLNLKTLLEKFSLVFRKVFSFYFGRKTLSENCEKFRNVILLLIISNLMILKLLIDIYIYIYIFFFFWNYFFNFIP